MTCHDARERLSALLDDALGADEHQRLLEHLATCSDCARERDRLAATVTLLRAVTPARAPAGFVDRVLATTRPVPWYRRLLRAVLLPWPVKLPIEAAAIVLLGIGVTYLYQRTPELRDAARVQSPQSPAEHPAPKPSEPAETEKLQASAPLKQAHVDSLRSKDGVARSNERKAEVGSQKTESFRQGRAFDADAAKPDDFKDRERDTRARSDAEKSRDAFKRDVRAPERREEAPAAQPERMTAPPSSSTLSPPPAATPPPAVATQPSAQAPPPPVAVTPPVAESAPPAARGSVSEPQAKEQAARNLVVPQDRASPQATTPDTLAQSAPLPQAPAAGAPAQKTAKALDARVESRVAKMRRAPDVNGRLSVANRSEAERALLELAARHAGTLVERRVDGDSPVLTFNVPRASYVAFARDLATLGRFTPDREPGAAGDLVEIVITLE